MVGGGRDDSHVSATGEEKREHRFALVDSAQFEECYGEYGLSVRAYLVKHGWGEHVDDLTQEVFLRAWRGRCNYQGHSSFQTYLIGIARKVAIEHLRQESRADSMNNHARMCSGQQEGVIPGLSQQLDPVLSAVCNGEMCKVVLQAVSQMPVIYRQAIELGVMAGLSSSEAGKRAGCNRETFRKRLYRAVKMLRQTIQGKKRH